MERRAGSRPGVRTGGFLGGEPLRTRLKVDDPWAATAAVCSAVVVVLFTECDHRCPAIVAGLISSLSSRWTLSSLGVSVGDIEMPYPPLTGEERSALLRYHGAFVSAACADTTPEFTGWSQPSTRDQPRRLDQLAVLRAVVKISRALAPLQERSRTSSWTDDRWWQVVAVDEDGEIVVREETGPSVLDASTSLMRSLSTKTTRLVDNRRDVARGVICAASTAAIAVASLAADVCPAGGAGVVCVSDGRTPFLDVAAEALLHNGLDVWADARGTAEVVDMLWQVGYLLGSVGDVRSLGAHMTGPSLSISFIVLGGFTSYSVSKEVGGMLGRWVDCQWKWPREPIRPDPRNRSALTAGRERMFFAHDGEILELSWVNPFPRPGLETSFSCDAGDQAHPDCEFARPGVGDNEADEPFRCGYQHVTPDGARDVSQFFTAATGFDVCARCADSSMRFTRDSLLRWLQGRVLPAPQPLSRPGFSDYIEASATRDGTRIHVAVQGSPGLYAVVMVVPDESPAAAVLEVLEAGNVPGDALHLLPPAWREETCSICLHPVESGGRPCRTKCGHLFHFPCLQLQRRRIADSYGLSCPNCRRDLTGDSLLCSDGPDKGKNEAVVECDVHGAPLRPDRSYSVVALLCHEPDAPVDTYTVCARAGGSA